MNSFPHSVFYSAKYINFQDGKGSGCSRKELVGLFNICLLLLLKGIYVVTKKHRRRQTSFQTEGKPHKKLVQQSFRVTREHFGVRDMTFTKVLLARPANTDA